MKKSIFLMAGLVGLALTSCKDDMPTGTLQKNEAPIEVPADGVALQSLYATSGNYISLSDYEETSIPLVDIELSSLISDGSSVTGQVEIADNEDFTNAETISLSTIVASSTNSTLAAAAGGDTRSFKGVVNALAWNEAFQVFYGYNPAPEVNYVRFRLWLNNGKQNIILYANNGTEWFDAMEFTVTPIDAKLDVASSYTLHYTVSGSSEEQTVTMYHNPEKHVYDDPNFNATVTVPESDGENEVVLSWWITSDDDAAKAYGVEAAEPGATSGSLGLKGDEFVDGQISGAGVYKIEANMLDLTYEVKLAPPSLYVVSTSYISFPQAAQLGTTDNIVYSGLAGIEGPWGLTGQAAYKPTIYTNDADVDVTTAENGTVTGGLLFDTSGAPLNTNSAIPLAGQRGMFYVTANLQTLKYTLYRCNTMGITGSMEAQNWGAGPDLALTNSRTTYYMEWKGQLTVKAGNEWKFRANNDWAVNFGAANGSSYATDGSPVELSMDGGNFMAEEDGTYDIVVHFRRYLEDGKLTPYYMTVTPAK